MAVRVMKYLQTCSMHIIFTVISVTPESSLEFSEDSLENDQRFSVYWGLQTVLPVQVQY